MFAQLPDPNSYAAIGWLVVGLSALCVAVFTALNQGSEFIQRMRAQKETREVNVTGQPLEVRASTEFVVRKDFDAFALRNDEEHAKFFAKLGGSERGTGDKLDMIRREMHEMENRLNKDGEIRISKVHERVNDVLEAVAELRGQVRGENQ